MRYGLNIDLVLRQLFGIANFFSISYWEWGQTYFKVFPPRRDIDCLFDSQLFGTIRHYALNQGDLSSNTKCQLKLATDPMQNVATPPRIGVDVSSSSEIGTGLTTHTSVKL